MKFVVLFLAFFLCAGFVKSQVVNENPPRYIEVTGSSEMEVEPDEIRFVIGIEEYWKEEFDKNTKFKDYKTKIPISEIEKNLFDDLATLGIQKENIITKDVGNYWRYKGKEFLISKDFVIVLKDFRLVNEIIRTIDTKGIENMRIDELKNKDITELRKQVKIQALKAAKMKADYLLASIDQQIGKVISISEIDNETNYWSPQSLTSNTIMPVSGSGNNDNVRKIKLRYEIKARFEIK